MARTLIAPDRKTVRTSVMLPEDTHLQVQALADANHVSSAWIVRMAIQRFLEEHQGASLHRIHQRHGPEYLYYRHLGQEHTAQYRVGTQHS